MLNKLRNSLASLIERMAAAAARAIRPAGGGGKGEEK